MPRSEIFGFERGLFSGFDKIVKQEDRLFDSNEEMTLYCQHEIDRFFKHIKIREHISDITTLSNITTSSFHFLREVNQANNIEDILVQNLLENVQGFGIEKREKGLCLVAYSVLPILSKVEFLGNVILQLQGLPLCIAVRRFQLFEQGRHLTDTVKIPFSIEQSTNGKLRRFKICTAFPCQQVTYNKHTKRYVDYFPEMVQYSACQQQTLQIIPELLQMRIGARGDIAQNLVTVSNGMPYTLDTFVFQLVPQKILEMQLQAINLNAELRQLSAIVELQVKQTDGFCQECQSVSLQVRKSQGVANKSIPNAELQINEFHKEIEQQKLILAQLIDEINQKNRVKTNSLIQLNEQTEKYIADIKLNIEIIKELSKLDGLIYNMNKPYIEPLQKQLDFLLVEAQRLKTTCNESQQKFLKMMHATNEAAEAAQQAFVSKQNLLDIKFECINHVKQLNVKIQQYRGTTEFCQNK